ncbi:MAG TPA: ribokinase [Nitriliruptorales bacterium]
MATDQAAGGPPRIVSVGALVVDLTFWAARRPGPGETLLGTRFEEFLGGKGFNQAIAAARLGADVTMVGAVGQDGYGDRFLAALAADHVATDAIARVAQGTGVGQPLVTDDGEVAIVGIPRANGHVSAATVAAAAQAIADADALLVQCEVPIEASVHAARLARAAGARVVVNPAPAGPEGIALADLADLLIVNEVEAGMLLGSTSGDAEAAAKAVHERFGCPVVVTLGARGALYHDGTTASVDAHRVTTVDPTGAGDAFVAGFTVATLQGRAPDQALRFANAVGACAVQVAGAEPSMPALEQVEELLLAAGAARPGA